jgi:geranylgeranyl diphosphate synthase type I
MTMIYKKTSALIESCTAIGAIVSGAPESIIEKARVYGRSIGLAFQIKDDILGVFGKEELTGKPVYSDLREGKKTLLVIKALEKADESQKQVINSVLGKRDLPKSEYEKAAQLIEKLGVRKEVEEEARRLSEKAKRVLGEMGGVKEEYKKMLEELATYVVARER